MDAKSSWICESERDLSSVIVELPVFPEKDNTEFLALLDEEKCISLRKPPNSPDLDCSIIIDASNNFVKSKSDKDIPNASKTSLIQQINKTSIKSEAGEASSSRINSPFPSACLPESNYLTEILILSESKFIETFLNSYQEYYQTFQSTLISQFEDSNIYKTIIVFQKPEVSVLLKLKGLFCDDSLWVYGIFIKTKLNSQTNPIPSIATNAISNQRSNDIDSLLKEKGVNLSERAEKFKKLFQICNATQIHSPMYITDAVATFSMLNQQGEKDSAFQNFKQMMASVEDEKIHEELSERSLSSPRRNADYYSAEGMNKMLTKMTEYVSSGTVSSDMPPSLQALLHSLPQHGANKSVNYATKAVDKNLILPGDRLSPSRAAVPMSVTINQADLKLIETTVENVVDKKMHELEKKLEYNMDKSHEIIHKRLDNIEFLLKKCIDIKWNPT